MKAAFADVFRAQGNQSRSNAPPGGAGPQWLQHQPSINRPQRGTRPQQRQPASVMAHPQPEVKFPTNCVDNMESACQKQDVSARTQAHFIPRMTSGEQVIDTRAGNRHQQHGQAQLASHPPVTLGQQVIDNGAGVRRGSHLQSQPYPNSCSTPGQHVIDNDAGTRRRPMPSISNTPHAVAPSPRVAQNPSTSIQQKNRASLQAIPPYSAPRLVQGQQAINNGAGARRQLMPSTSNTPRGVVPSPRVAQNPFTEIIRARTQGTQPFVDPRVTPRQQVINNGAGGHQRHPYASHTPQVIAPLNHVAQAAPTKASPDNDPLNEANYANHLRMLTNLDAEEEDPSSSIASSFFPDTLPEGTSNEAEAGKDVGTYIPDLTTDECAIQALIDASKDRVPVITGGAIPHYKPGGINGSNYQYVDQMPDADDVDSSSGGLEQHVHGVRQGDVAAECDQYYPRLVLAPASAPIQQGASSLPQPWTPATSVGTSSQHASASMLTAPRPPQQQILQIVPSSASVAQTVPRTASTRISRDSKDKKEEARRQCGQDDITNTPFATKLNFLPGYPLSNAPIPQGSTLEDICQYFPNHLSREGLDPFFQWRWSYIDIWNAVPEQIKRLWHRHGIIGPHNDDPRMFLNGRVRVSRRQLLADRAFGHLMFAQKIYHATTGPREGVTGLDGYLMQEGWVKQPGGQWVLGTPGPAAQVGSNKKRRSNTDEDDEDAPQAKKARTETDQQSVVPPTAATVNVQSAQAPRPAAVAGVQSATDHQARLIKKPQPKKRTARPSALPAPKEAFGVIWKRQVRIQPTKREPLGEFFGQKLWAHEDDFKTIVNSHINVMHDYNAKVEKVLDADSDIPKDSATPSIADFTARFDQKLSLLGWSEDRRRAILDPPTPYIVVLQHKMPVHVHLTVASMVEEEAYKYVLTLEETVRDTLSNSDQEEDLVEQVRNAIVQGMAARLQSVRDSIDEKLESLVSKTHAEAVGEAGKSDVGNSPRGRKRGIEDSEDDEQNSRKRSRVEEEPKSSTNARQSPPSFAVSSEASGEETPPLGSSSTAQTTPLGSYSPDTTAFGKPKIVRTEDEGQSNPPAVNDHDSAFIEMFGVNEVHMRNAYQRPFPSNGASQEPAVKENTAEVNTNKLEDPEDFSTYNLDDVLEYAKVSNDFSEQFQASKEEFEPQVDVYMGGEAAELDWNDPSF